MIVAGCGGVGFRIAATYRFEEKMLRQFLGILDYMENELSYRMTPLPGLCRQAASQSSGPLQRCFRSIATELDAQISPNVTRCVNAALEKNKDIPPVTAEMIRLMGATLGCFDLEGQVAGFAAVKQETARRLGDHCTNKTSRLRSYQTLGLCAGAALAILFI